ncbi:MULTISPECIES: ABC transporter permease subunit [Pirellulaceae]|nr:MULTISPECIES: ABC transporter permease subunit [Pirellulaceae]
MRFSDVLSEGVITVGGIGTIVAVCLVALVLVMEVVPLFRSATVRMLSERATPWLPGEIVHFELNEYQTMGWLLTRDGTLQSVRLTSPKSESQTAGSPVLSASFEVVQESKLVTGAEITAVSTTTGKSDIVLGLADGNVCTGDVRFETTFIDPIEIKDWFSQQAGGLSAAKLKSPGDTAIFKQGVVQLTSQGQYRVQQLVWTLDYPIEVSDAPIDLIDHLPVDGNAGGIGAKERVFVALSGDKQLKLGVVSEKKSLLTGKVKRTTKIHDLPSAEGLGDPAFILISGLGNNVLAADRDGHLARFSIRDYDDIQLAEEVDLLPDSDAKLSKCDWILGRETLFCGDSQGNCSGWFQIRLEDRKDDAFADRESTDGFVLVQAHKFPTGPAAVTAFGASSRSRMFLVGYESGLCSLFHMTTEKHVADIRVSDDQSIQLARIAPRDDGLLLESGGDIAHYALSPGFPDITLSSLFFPVWYEGYAEPLNIWQSSSSKVEDELKFSLFPLISGTFKATFYSMLFGAPLALLAAIYTSEFATRRTRTFVKPAVEMMASLPSVVLGFVAALVFAPIVENIIPACLASIFIVPFVVLLGGFLWQMLPHSVSLRIQPFRLVFLVPMLLAGIYFAYLLGPAIEAWLFLGNIKYWLVHPEEGTGLGGWLLILLPASALAMLALDGYGLGSYWRSRVAKLPRSVFAVISFVKFLALAVLTLLLAVVVGSVFDFAGWDPRGSYIGEYDQRNSMIVGFVMGFAVIPIIYTIADDALSTVPSHLRSASLGCGATPWQTTLRIVIPTAMSGLFSALMIGLGRVTGETMIVLMAGGNTPIEDWNLFNGFRTLSTNIAIELPEAVQGSSHYRVLFLSALVLFMLTFLINTVAEVVRLYFRRRAVQL